MTPIFMSLKQTPKAAIDSNTIDKGDSKKMMKASFGRKNKEPQVSTTATTTMGKKFQLFMNNKKNNKTEIESARVKLDSNFTIEVPELWDDGEDEPDYLSAERSLSAGDLTAYSSDSENEDFLDTHEEDEEFIPEPWAESDKASAVNTIRDETRFQESKLEELREQIERKSLQVAAQFMSGKASGVVITMEQLLDLESKRDRCLHIISTLKDLSSRIQSQSETCRQTANFQATIMSILTVPASERTFDNQTEIFDEAEARVVALSILSQESESTTTEL